MIQWTASINGYNDNSVIASNFGNFVWFTYKLRVKNLVYNELGNNENLALANGICIKNEPKRSVITSITSKITKKHFALYSVLTNATVSNN